MHGSLQDTPVLQRSIQLFNGVSQWIQCMILSKTTPKQRADIIHKFLEIATHLRRLLNYNSLMAVVGGICHSAISRLYKTNLFLSVEDQKVGTGKLWPEASYKNIDLTLFVLFCFCFYEQILNDITELMSSSCNYSQYRKAICQIRDQFWIPIV